MASESNSISMFRMTVWRMSDYEKQNCYASGTPVELAEFWRWLYGHIISSTGWTYRYVDGELTLPEAMELIDYWSEYPPPHVCIRAYLGIDNKKAKPVEQCSEQELQAFLTELGGITG